MGESCAPTGSDPHYAKVWGCVCVCVCASLWVYVCAQQNVLIMLKMCKTISVSRYGACRPSGRRAAGQAPCLFIDVKQKVVVFFDCLASGAGWMGARNGRVPICVSTHIHIHVRVCVWVGEFAVWARSLCWPVACMLYKFYNPARDDNASGNYLTWFIYICQHVQGLGVGLGPIIIVVSNIMKLATI